MTITTTPAIGRHPARVGRALARAVEAAGATLPAELADIIDAAAAVDAWPAPEPTDIASVARAGKLTAATAHGILDAALIQPNRSPADIRFAARDGLAKRFRHAVRNGAGDSIIESLQKPFTAAVKKINRASETISPQHRAEHVISIDGGPQAWAVLAQAARELDRIAAVAEVLVGSDYEVLGPAQPWHHNLGGDVRRAAMFTPDADSITRVIGALNTPASAARAGRWHYAAPLVTLNTPSAARQIHDELAEAAAAAKQAEYEAAHA